MAEIIFSRLRPRNDAEKLSGKRKGTIFLHEVD